MAFSQASITEPPVLRILGAELFVSWRTSAPAGTVFQLYRDRKLVWYGVKTATVLPLGSGSALYEVGTVGTNEGPLDFSSSLPVIGGTGNRAILNWLGGTYLSTDIAGFNIYGESGPGVGISYASPLAKVPAYSAATQTDGAGFGGAGLGGAGVANAYYTWTSPPLSRSGVWNYAVKPYDAWGNEGAAQLFAVPLVVAPNAPARNAAGSRLTYSYNLSTNVATLSWLASP